jgi:hypothetical protein
MTRDSDHRDATAAPQADLISALKSCSNARHEVFAVDPISGRRIKAESAPLDCELSKTTIDSPDAIPVRAPHLARDLVGFGGGGAASFRSLTNRDCGCCGAARTRPPEQASIEATHERTFTARQASVPRLLDSAREARRSGTPAGSSPWALSNRVVTHGAAPVVVDPTTGRVVRDDASSRPSGWGLRQETLPAGIQRVDPTTGRALPEDLRDFSPYRDVGLYHDAPGVGVYPNYPRVNAQAATGLAKASKVTRTVLYVPWSDVFYKPAIPHPVINEEELSRYMKPFLDQWVSHSGGLGLDIEIAFIIHNPAIKQAPDGELYPSHLKKSDKATAIVQFNAFYDAVYAILRNNPYRSAGYIMSLGSEVDLYLPINAWFWNEYRDFYEAVSSHVKTTSSDLASVRTGVTVNYSHMRILGKKCAGFVANLNRTSDVVIFNYYPNLYWTNVPGNDELAVYGLEGAIRRHFIQMVSIIASARIVGGDARSPVGLLQEVGYPSELTVEGQAFQNPTLGQTAQRDFVAALFKVFKEFNSLPQDPIKYMTWWSLFDYGSSSGSADCLEFVNLWGLDATNWFLCKQLCTSGLIFADGNSKSAWLEFSANAQALAF